MANFQCKAIPFFFFFEGLRVEGLRTAVTFERGFDVARATALSKEVLVFFFGAGTLQYRI